jgi:hypothetical protein
VLRDSLPCDPSLPCAAHLCHATCRCRAAWRCRACGIAVRPPPPFAVRRWASPPGKDLCMHTTPAPECTGSRHMASLPCVCTRQHDQMVLCRVHTHGKWPVSFSVFSIFLLFPAFQNWRYTYMHIYNLKYIKHTKYMHICMHITSNTSLTANTCIYACI